MGPLNRAIELPNGYPVMDIYYQATNSKPATHALMSTNIIISFHTLFEFWASMTRSFRAFAKRNGLSYPKFFAAAVSCHRYI